MDILGPRSQTLGTWLAFLVAAGWAMYELRKDDQLPTGATMSSRLLPILLIATLFITAAMHVIAAIINRRKQEASEDKSQKKPSEKRVSTVPPAQRADITHEDCQRQIRDLKSTISRLQQHEQTQGIQISARDGQIEQLQAKLDGFKWLRSILHQQAESIHDFILINGCELGKFELFQRHDPYIEFRVTFWNLSVYDVCLGELSGSMQYHKRELTGQIQWREANRLLTWFNQLGFTIRQYLSPDDVTYIMNQPATERFSLHSVESYIKGAREAESKISPRLLNIRCTQLSNEPLLNAYPKLRINILSLTATYIVNLFSHGGTQDALVTIETAMKNERNFPVVIDSANLEIHVKEGTHVAAAEFGDIWEKKHINEAGELITSGKKLINLADRLPLRMLQADISGNFQFVFRGVGAAIVSPSIPYRLIITDTHGEKHSCAGVINEQPLEVPFK